MQYIARSQTDYGEADSLSPLLTGGNMPDPELDRWIASQRAELGNPQEPAAPAEHAWYDRGLHGHPAHPAGEFQGDEFIIPGHEHEHMNIRVTIPECFVAMLVAAVVAFVISIPGLFLPTNGIPAVIGVVFGIVAIGCFIIIWFTKPRWKRWLIAFGVGLGFYVLWVLYFWA